MQRERYLLMLNSYRGCAIKDTKEYHHFSYKIIVPGNPKLAKEKIKKKKQ